MHIEFLLDLSAKSSVGRSKYSSIISLWRLLRTDHVSSHPMLLTCRGSPLPSSLPFGVRHRGARRWLRPILLFFIVYLLAVSICGLSQQSLVFPTCQPVFPGSQSSFQTVPAQPCIKVRDLSLSEKDRNFFFGPQRWLNKSIIQPSLRFPLRMK